MNLKIITKNHADDSKIGSPLKIDFKAEIPDSRVQADSLGVKKFLFKFFV